MATRYRNAWNCRKCPERNDEQGCPAWIEYAETNQATGELRTIRECGFQAMPKFLTHTMAAAERAAATVDSHRNEIVAAMAEAGRVYMARRAAGGDPQAPAPALPAPAAPAAGEPATAPPAAALPAPESAPAAAPGGAPAEAAD